MACISPPSLNQGSANIDPLLPFMKNEKPDCIHDDEAEINISQWLKLDSIDLAQTSWNSTNDNICDLSVDLSLDHSENNNSNDYSEHSGFLSYRNVPPVSNSYCFVPIHDSIPSSPPPHVSSQLPPPLLPSTYSPSSYFVVPYCPYSCCSPSNHSSTSCPSSTTSCCPASSIGTPYYSAPHSSHNSYSHAMHTPSSNIPYAQAVSPTRSRSPSPIQMYSSSSSSQSSSSSYVRHANHRTSKQVEDHNTSCDTKPKLRHNNSITLLSSSSSSSPSSSSSLLSNLNETGPVRRVRQTRPKVVEAKGAQQCKGRNRKKGIQCRNAALMEYIGPRPEFCAEHIDLDPKSLYTKCKSPYQKELGDNKGCKEVVLKEFGICYKHYGDEINQIIHNRELDKLKAQLLRITDLLGQLEREALAAKKKDGDLYQRKNKLIPKFQEMKKLCSRAIELLQNNNSNNSNNSSVVTAALGESTTTTPFSFITTPSPPSSYSSPIHSPAPSPSSSPSCSYGVIIGSPFSVSFKEDIDIDSGSTSSEDFSSSEETFSPVLINTHTLFLHPPTNNNNEPDNDSDVFSDNCSSPLSCDFLV